MEKHYDVTPNGGAGKKRIRNSQLFDEFLLGDKAAVPSEQIAENKFQHTIPDVKYGR